MEASPAPSCSDDGQNAVAEAVGVLVGVFIAESIEEKLLLAVEVRLRYRL